MAHIVISDEAKVAIEAIAGNPFQWKDLPGETADTATRRHTDELGCP